MTGSQREAMLAEIVELAGIPSPQQEDEFTITEFRQKAGIGWSTAQRQLELLVDSGLLAKRQGLVDGRQCWLFRKATG